MLKALVYKFGSNPVRSWKHFKIGLGLFVVGALVVVFGPRLSPLLQIPGVILLLVGFALAAKGYLGLFCNRFAQSLNRAGDLRARFDNNKPRD